MYPGEEFGVRGCRFCEYELLLKSPLCALSDETVAQIGLTPRALLQDWFAWRKFNVP